MLPAPRPWSRERCSCRRSSCAGTVDDAIALAYGPNNPAASIVNRRALGSKLTGQQQIGRAVAHFIGVKLRNRISGRTRR